MSDVPCVWLWGNYIQYAQLCVIFTVNAVAAASASEVAFTENFIREDRRKGQYCCSFLIFLFHVIVQFLLACSGVGEGIYIGTWLLH